MRYTVSNCNNVRIIPLGQAGENNYTEIAFDISTWQNEFDSIDSIALLMQRVNDTEAYIADVVIDGKYAVHTLTETDLAFVGNGKCQLVLTSGDVIAKSKVFSTICYCSLNSGDTPPSPQGMWWVGTQEEYDAIAHYPYVMYFIVDEIEPHQPKIPAGIYTGIQSGIAAPIEFEFDIPFQYSQGGDLKTAYRIKSFTIPDWGWVIGAYTAPNEMDDIGAYINGGVFMGSLDDEQFEVTADTEVSQADYDAFMTYFTAVD